jgi:hypothetical protein
MPIEGVYADHSDSMKKLANQARLEYLHTGNLKYDKNAARVYASEVAELNRDLDLAKRNRPIERQAQLIAAASVQAKVESNPHLDEDDRKKLRGRELQAARTRLGAKKEPVDLSGRKWEAIQAGAISHTKLKEILENADPETVRKLATPRKATVMTDSKLALARARLSAGYSEREVADSLGVPLSTLTSALKR